MPYLTGYQYVDELECVLELFMKYCSRNKETLVYGYMWLENNYGVDISSSPSDFYCQKTHLIKQDIDIINVK